ncbi:MAG: hypothetical protein ACP5NV_01445 [Candidatus Woesearchaeota archaeon]
MNDRKEYFNISKILGLKIDKCIDDYLNTNIVGEEKRKVYDVMLVKKNGKQKLRANILYLAYCAFTEKDPSKEESFDDKIVRLSASAELLIWSQYMVNWIYDSKANTKDENVRKKTAICANAFLNDSIALLTKSDSNIIEPMLKINDYVIASFTPEFLGMNITNKEMLYNKQKYFDKYNNEYAIPGVGKFFEGLINIAAITSGYENKEKVVETGKIFNEFGRDHETLNALGDFILDQELTNEKNPSDQYSDIKNNTLTPPIWHMYNRSSEEDKNKILLKAGKPLTIEDKKYFLKLLFETGTYDVLTKELKHASRVYKKKLSKIELYKPASKIMNQLLSVYESNKIYHYLEENYSTIKGETK